MAREIPEVVRAAAGLAATVLDEARKLPETLPGLPVRLIGLAMQHAMKVQQQYAGFVARGDELFTGLRGEDEPGLATFDDDVDEPQPASTGFRESAFDRAGDTEPTSANIDLIIDEEVAAAKDAPDSEAILDEIAIDELVDQAPTLEETAPAAPSAAEATVKAASKAAKAPAKAAKSAAKAASKAADAAEAPVQAAAKLAEPVKATKARKPAKSSGPVKDAAVTEDAAVLETALLEAALAAPDTSEDASPAADSSTPADSSTTESPAGASTSGTPTTPTATTPTPTAAGEVTAPAKAAPADAAVSGNATATDEGGTAIATASAGAGAAPSAPRSAPIDGYDAFTVAQLRGRLRGYALTTVEELVAYEQATRARESYLTMLRNRLEKLEEQAIESSPLAPRGA